MPLRVAHPYLEDDNYARPQHQLYSNARSAPPQAISNSTICRQSTSTYEPTANDFTDSNTSPVYLQDLDNLTDLFGASHDEYPLYNDLYTTTTDNTVSMYTSNISDPFIESATIPAMASTMGCTAPTRAISSEEEILANVDIDLCDLEEDLDIGQLMKYLQDDSPTGPGFEENIFERVDQEPNTPETIPETTQFNDYFAVPSTSGFVAPTSVTTQSDLDPVQEFFPEMCVEVSSTTTTGFDVYDNQAMYTEWQPYEQYSPSHTPASVDSSNSSSNSWSKGFEPKRTARKRPYPAPSVSTFSNFDDDYRCKRDKNNKASQISRQKHKEKVDRDKKESVELVARNESLKLEVDTLEQQIATMRAVLMDSIATAQK